MSPSMLYTDSTTTKRSPAQGVSVTNRAMASTSLCGQTTRCARDSLPPPPDADALRALATDVPALWHAPTTSNKDRKRLLRTLVCDVTLLPEPDRGKARTPL